MVKEADPINPLSQLCVENWLTSARGSMGYVGGHLCYTRKGNCRHDVSGY